MCDFVCFGVAFSVFLELWSLGLFREFLPLSSGVSMRTDGLLFIYLIFYFFLILKCLLELLSSVSKSLFCDDPTNSHREMTHQPGSRWCVAIPTI